MDKDKTLKFVKQLIEDNIDKIQEFIDQQETAKEPAPRYYKGQPVWVRDHDKDEWVPEFLIRIEHGKTFLYKGNAGSWKQCKPRGETHPAWIKHTGPETVPDDGVSVVVRLRIGHLNGGISQSFNWAIDNNPGDIIEFCIIPDKEYL